MGKHCLLEGQTTFSHPRTSDGFENSKGEQEAIMSGTQTYASAGSPLQFSVFQMEIRLSAKIIIWGCILVIWTNVDKIHVEAQKTHYL